LSSHSSSVADCLIASASMADSSSWNCFNNSKILPLMALSVNLQLRNRTVRHITAPPTEAGTIHRQATP
jgi:hypothetical protein